MGIFFFKRCSHWHQRLHSEIHGLKKKRTSLFCMDFFSKNQGHPDWLEMFEFASDGLVFGNTLSFEGDKVSNMLKSSSSYFSSHSFPV